MVGHWQIVVLFDIEATVLHQVTIKLDAAPITCAYVGSPASHCRFCLYPVKVSAGFSVPSLKCSSHRMCREAERPAATYLKLTKCSRNSSRNV